MKNRFSYLLILVISLSLITISTLNVSNYITIANEPIIRKLLYVLFIVSSIGFTLKTAIPKTNRNFRLIKNNTLPTIGLSTLLVSTTFNQTTTKYASILLLMIALVQFLITRKTFTFNKLYFSIFGYAALLALGTISTASGFHIPEITLIFYFLPLAFLFVDFTKDELLNIAYGFIRILMVYMTFSIIYWWFNHFYLQTDFLQWVTQKLNFVQTMIGWEKQLLENNGSNAFSAYFFVNSWSNYFHPSYISLVLISGLILTFYLFIFDKRENRMRKLEFLLFIALCLLVVMLMQSRIGFILSVFVVAAGSLYYFKHKTNYYLKISFLYITLGFIVFILASNLIFGFINDEARDFYRTLAFEYTQDHFWWGTGYHGQPGALEQLAQANYSENPYAHYPIIYVHNQLLGNMVQFGIWGAIALVAMLLTLISYGVKNKKIILLIFLTAFILFMVIEEPLYRFDGISRFMIFLVFLLSISEVNNYQDEKTTK